MTENSARATDHEGARVGVACVTQDRPGDVDTLIDALRVQTEPVASLCLVDAGRTALDEDRLRQRIGGAFALHYRRSEANLGGAGGFALAILTALAAGSEQVWLMDDDAHPEDPECLAVLRTAARERDLAVVSPLIVAPQLTAGTAYAVDNSAVIAVVRRDATVETSDAPHWSSDRISVRTTMRAAWGFADPARVVRMTKAAA